MIELTRKKEKMTGNVNFITNYYGFHNSKLWEWINLQRGVNGNG